jgi:hypothetical protein
MLSVYLVTHQCATHATSVHKCYDKASAKKWKLSLNWQLYVKKTPNEKQQESNILS